MAAAALILGACARPSSAPLEASPGDSVEVAVGESVAVRGSSARVLFVGANDSRCPSDVVCVTAGDAVIVLAFSGDAGARTDTIYLVRQPRSVNYAGYRFEAAGLNPYPKSTGPRPSPVLSLRILSLP